MSETNEVNKTNDLPVNSFEDNKTKIIKDLSELKVELDKLRNRC